MASRYQSHRFPQSLLPERPGHKSFTFRGHDHIWTTMRKVKRVDGFLKRFGSLEGMELEGSPGMSSRNSLWTTEQSMLLCFSAGFTTTLSSRAEFIPGTSLASRASGHSGDSKWPQVTKAGPENGLNRAPHKTRGKSGGGFAKMVRQPGWLPVASLSMPSTRGVSSLFFGEKHGRHDKCLVNCGCLCTFTKHCSSQGSQISTAPRAANMGRTSYTLVELVTRFRAAFLLAHMPFNQFLATHPPTSLLVDQRGTSSKAMALGQ